MKKLFLPLFLTVVLCYVQSQSFLMPFFDHFSKIDYQGENQIWGITQAYNGEVYLANNHFLLQYNGARWLKYQLPNKTTIRSVYAKRDTIYCGSYKDFGYWHYNDKREFKYYSLSEKFNTFKSQNSEDIWKITEASHDIFFQSFSKIYRYQNQKNRISTYDVKETITNSFKVGNDLWISTLSGKIYVWNGEKFVLKIQELLLRDNIIVSVQKVNNQLWFFTQKNGIYILENGILKPANHALHNLCKENLINTIEKIENTLVIGTIKAGLFFFDIEKNSCKVINRENGLLNNTVLSIYTDKEHNIWIGLDDGICYVELQSPVLYYQNIQGKLGTVYDVMPVENNFYLASNQGIFHINGEGKQSMIPNSDGLSWSFFSNQESIFCGRNEGTFVLKNENLSQINSITGGWKFKKIRDNYYIQSTYTGLYLYTNKNNSWTTSKIVGLNNPIKNISVLLPNHIFAIDEHKGVYMVKYNTTFTQNQVLNLTKKSGIKEDYNCYIVELKGVPYFLINKKWYIYNSLKEILEPSDIFNKELEGGNEAYSISHNEFLLINNQAAQIINIENGNFQKHIIKAKYHKGKLVPQYVSVQKVGESYLLSMMDGFFYYKKPTETTPIIKPTVKLFHKDTYVAVTENIPYYHAQLYLDIVSGYYGINQPTYYYSIGKDNKKEIVLNNKIDISTLGSGKHTIVIYQYSNNEFHLVKKTDITINSPWYITGFAFLAYLCIVALGWYIYYRYNKLKYQQKIQLIEEESKHKHEISLLEKQKEAEKAQFSLEKKSLELEYTNKSNELAAKALHLAKYNELEEEIKKLIQETTNSELKNKLTKLIKIQNAQKEWEIFEDNINIVHQDFIKRLLEMHPILTPKDIQLAVFLRMNLTSKEIAPLMAISFRGVEVHRYRLRKKINLDASENLTKFMMNF